MSRYFVVSFPVQVEETGPYFEGPVKESSTMRVELHIHATSAEHAVSIVQSRIQVIPDLVEAHNAHELITGVE